MTMQLGFSARDRRTLAIGAMGIGGLLLFARGAPAFRAWDSARRTEAATLADQIALASQATRLLPALRDSLRARQARFAAIDSLLLAGSGASAAAASLASSLEDIAVDAPVKISALQMRADTTTKAGLTRVAVRLTGVADVAGLAAFLRAVDGGDLHLAVRELAVSQPEPGAPESKPEALRIDVLVEGLGFIRPRAIK